MAAAGLEVGLGVEEEVTVEVGAGGWADRRLEAPAALVGSVAKAVRVGTGTLTSTVSCLGRESLLSWGHTPLGRLRRAALIAGPGSA